MPPSLPITTTMGAQAHGQRESSPIFFSVVIPASNAAAWIGQTLESVLGQSYPNFEVLVVDDGSRDATRDVVLRYAAQDARIRLVALSEASGGPSRPRNTGIRESRGDYVALLDADDLWARDKLLHDAEFLRARPADLLYSGAHYFRGEPHNIVHTVASRPPGSMLLVKNYVPTLTICMSREFCARQPVFEEDPMLGIEDYYLVLRAYLAGNVICNRPGTDAYYRQDSSASYYRRNDFGLVMRRHLYNLTKTAMAQRMTLPKLYTLWIALTLIFGAKKLLGRL